MSLEELVRRLPEAGELNALVYGPGMANWIEAKHVQAVAEGLKGKSGPPAPPTTRRSDEIDYEIFGEEMRYVEITLDPNEMVIAEAGAMMYDIQFVGGIKNTLFGGEELFFATLTGPVDIWCRSLPFARLAGRILANASGLSRKDEGSILGGLGSLIGGDTD